MAPPSSPTSAVLPPEAVPLRAEVEAGGERARQAVLLYEIGHIIEREGGADAQAVREYLGAYNLDATFRPPLFSLVRLFERRRSFKNLARLYEAELKSATTGQERASALLDRAALLADHLGQPEAEPPLLEQACDEDGESTAAPLTLEWRLRSNGAAPDALAAVLVTRAARTRDPVLKGMLLIELADLREAAGDVDGALDTLRAAARLPKERERFLRALERMARKHDRAPELVAALEGRAALLAGTDGNAATGSELYLEAARVRLGRLNDSEGARATLEKGLALTPDDVGLLREHMLACEGAGDALAAAKDAERLLGLVFGEGAFGAEPVGRHTAAFHFRIAEAAQLEGDGETALARLHQAAAAAPDSAVVSATVEDAAFATGELARVVGPLEAEAERLAGAGQADAAAECLLRAAAWARDVGRDLARTHQLFDRALALDNVAAPLVRRVKRERFLASVELGDIAGGTGIQPLIDEALALSESEAMAGDEAGAGGGSLVLRTAYHAALATPYEEAAVRRARARQVLEAALLHPQASLQWAADAARVFAAAQLGAEAEGGERDEHVALLVRAHGMLAERAGTADLSAAHFAAAARAAIKGGREETAIELLKEVVQKVPSHPYGVALLEEIYRRRGDADAVVRILREAAQGDATGRALGAQLLTAGAAAEVEGNTKLAISTYREAHTRDPDSDGPLAALRRLHDAHEASVADVVALAAAREARLAEAGTALVPWASLEVGESKLLANEPAAMEPLRRALAADATRVPAALGLALSSDKAARLEGVRALIEPTDAATLILRDQLALAAASDTPGATDDVLDAESALLARNAQERLVLVLRCLRSTPATEERAQALFALADATDDGRVAAELVLAGMRATTAARLVGHALDDDATLRAAEIADRAPEALEAALAYAEAFGDVDDAGERADALGRLLPLLDGAGLSPSAIASIRAEHARAVVAAGRGDEVLETLVQLTEDPNDLAAFETLRVAARDAGAHRLVVLACQRLAQALDGAAQGELRAQLLEEAAAVLMDYLEVDHEAEPLLRAALAIDPSRPIAYARLHDVLADKGDDAALLELLVARIDVTDDPEALAPLFYEEARMRRGLGQRDEALAALDNLFMLEAEHVGGLALLVEIHVQRESWQDAVDALRRLAEAKDVPVTQRRIARLGAADFLEKRLGSPAAAILELEAVEAMGAADRGLYERMAAISERAGDVPRALAALEKGAATATDPQDRAAIHRRRGALFARRDEPLMARDAYRDALAAAPLDVAAAQALAELVGPGERVKVGAGLEETARSRLAPDPTDPTLLRALRAAAGIKDDTALDRAVLVALVACRMASVEETQGFTLSAPTVRAGASVSADLLQRLRLEADAGPVLELAELANEALLELDRLDASSFGVGRAELMKAGTPQADAELPRLAAALGAPPSDLYVGGPDPAATVGFSYRGKPVWVFGASALAAPIRARFLTAQLALGLRLGVSPLVFRLVREGLDPATDALLALSAAAGAPLAAASGRSSVDALSARLAKVVSRRARRAAPEIATKLGDGRAVLTYLRNLRLTLLRVGAVACGDLGPALDVVSGSARTDLSTRENAEARELVRFWTSPLAFSLAAELHGSQATGAR